MILENIHGNLTALFIHNRVLYIGTTISWIKAQVLDRVIPITVLSTDYKVIYYSWVIASSLE